MALYRIIDPPQINWEEGESWHVERPLSNGECARFRFIGTRGEVQREVDNLNALVRVDVA